MPRPQSWNSQKTSLAARAPTLKRLELLENKRVLQQEILLMSNRRTAALGTAAVEEAACESAGDRVDNSRDRAAGSFGAAASEAEPPDAAPLGPEAAGVPNS